MPYVNVNGLEVFYYDDDLSDPWRARDTILINHYGAGDSTLYNRWVLPLAGDYRVIRWDRPGYGRSETPKFGYQITADSFVGDIVGFLDALGLEKVHYVGDKAASAAGLAFAATHPDRVQSLTLAACPLSGRRVRDVFLADAAGAIAKGAWVAAFDTPSGGRTLGSGIDALQDAYYRTVKSRIAPHVFAAALRCVADPSFDLEPLLEKVAAPTLLLSPDEEDPLVTRQDQELIADRILSCERLTLPGSSMHFPFTDAEWCAEQVHAFVGRHATNPPA